MDLEVMPAAPGRRRGELSLRQTTGPLGSGPDTQREASGRCKEAPSCSPELAATMGPLCQLRRGGGKHRLCQQFPLEGPSRAENRSGVRGDSGAWTDRTEGVTNSSEQQGGKSGTVPRREVSSILRGQDNFRGTPKGHTKR